MEKSNLEILLEISYDAIQVSNNIRAIFFFWREGGGGLGGKSFL